MTSFSSIKKCTNRSAKSTVIYSKSSLSLRVAINVTTKIGSLSIERPTILASGILGISLDVFNRIYKSGAGAVVTKSLSKEPLEGYTNPTIFSVKGGGWINAVGLSNPGVENFAKMIESNRDVPIIISLVGSVEKDFEFMIKQFENCKVAAFELNLSCPHVAKVGLEVGDDVELVGKIVKMIKGITKAPVFAKVGLGTTNYLETVSAAIRAGVDGITAINTLRAMAIDIETQRPILSNKIGGLSGIPIKPIAVRCVYEISSRFNIPIIGCGGIATWEDAVEFILAGASAVQIGSSVGNNWIEIFDEINNGIFQYMDKKKISKIEEMVGSAKKS